MELFFGFMDWTFWTKFIKTGSDFKWFGILYLEKFLDHVLKTVYRDYYEFEPDTSFLNAEKDSVTFNWGWKSGWSPNKGW